MTMAKTEDSKIDFDSDNLTAYSTSKLIEISRDKSYTNELRIQALALIVDRLSVGAWNES